MTITFEHHLKFLDAENVTTNVALTVLFNSLQHTDNALNKSALKNAIGKGALWLTRGKHTQRLRRLKKALQNNDQLHFYYNEQVLSTIVPEAKLIADLSDYSVWYKPYGMLSQGSKYSDHCTIARFVQQKLNPERAVFIVHRLDRAATGLILIAHSKKAARSLSAMFENRSISDKNEESSFEKHLLEKHYQIIVHGDHRQNHQPQIINTEVDGKPARSTFTCLDYNKDKDQSLVEVKIDSGRKHQIRLHAASIDFPVVGDRLHGIADQNETQNLQLCAVSLSFICPFFASNTYTETSPNNISNKEKRIKKHFELVESLRPKL